MVIFKNIKNFFQFHFIFILNVVQVHMCTVVRMNVFFQYPKTDIFNTSGNTTSSKSNASLSSSSLAFNMKVPLPHRLPFSHTPTNELPSWYVTIPFPCLYPRMNSPSYLSRLLLVNVPIPCISPLCHSPSYCEPSLFR